MKTFTRPKIFRSTEGCCICKAKSSSSRFTDSEKYEDDFAGCFQLAEERSGEICNACVLVVKRWRKLPRRKIRNWSHVVDAKAGPGGGAGARSNSAKKARSSAKKGEVRASEEKLHKIRRKLQKRPKSSRQLVFAAPVSRVRDCSRKKSVPRRWGGRVEADTNIAEVFQTDYWKTVTGCCGPIHIGQQGERSVEVEKCRSCSNNTNNNTNNDSAAANISNFVESELKMLQSQELLKRSDLDEGFYDKTSTNPSSPESVRTITDEFCDEA